jgi:hypothetical protein
MESSINRGLRKKSLPGECQGTSGAGAGCCSIRATGDRLLKRRAPIRIPETNTAEESTSDNENGSAHQQQITSAGSVFQENLGTTKADLPIQCRKWTDETNQFLLCCYLRTTKLEMELIGYRQRIHQQFKNKYPDWQNITEQRLSDQLKTNQRNNLVPETIINKIREEVRIEQRNVEEEEDVINLEDKNITNSFEDRSDQSNIEQNQELINSTINEQNPKINSIHDRYIEMQIKYGKLQAKLRPPLPKINNSTKLMQTIAIVNNYILPRYLNDEINLEEIHIHVYIVAITTLSTIGLNVTEHRERERKQ